MVETRTLSVETRGFCDLKDLTGTVEGVIRETSVTDGIVTVFVPGATAGVTTIEYEPGAVQDLQERVEAWIPSTTPYHHNARWGDGNGFSHVRAALIGPSLTVPFRDGTLLLGTWQQIVLLDFDNRPRTRRVVVQVMGETAS